jgi:cytosine/adenosine deaminase-related metal-dependent hydrolase
MIILKDATFINYQTLEFRNTHILVEEGMDSKIKFIDSILEYPDATIIDCKEKLVTKSFACGHHHAYSALATGMPASKKRITNFYDTLQYLWWVLDKALDKDMVEASALATAVACAKNGTTFIIDHHSSPNFIEGSLEVIQKAFDKVGVAHLLCYEITDRNGMKPAEEALSETESYLKKHQGLVGLHASFTVDDETFEKAIAIAEKYNTGIHIHTAEDDIDQKHCMRQYKKRIIERFFKSGAIKSPKTILAHCIHLDSSEKGILKNTPVWIAQNPDSNLNNQVGYFNSEWLPEIVMLGTDGMHSDMLRSARTAYFSGKNYEEIDFQIIYQRFRKVHQYIQKNAFIGDGENNLVVLDYPSFTPINQDNFLGHFIFSLESKHIQHVIANGKIIVKDRIIQTVNETEVTKFCREQAIRLWEKFKTIS